MNGSVNGAVDSPDFDSGVLRGDARNIAITGATAADRSALAESWRKAAGDLGWMNVSVPHFNGGATPVSSLDAEDAIINQIVCQMDLAKSPKSRFRNTMKGRRELDAAFAVSVAALVALTAFLIWIAGLLPSQRPATALCVIAIIAWLACIGFIVFRIVRSGAIARLAARLRPDEAIELSDEETGSRLERYMSDLVYLFDTNDYDVVVFEGVDSYRYLPLFERLRALNLLANARRGGSREALRFIYLVNDSLFEDPHERAAFFDRIVPVIPFVESTDVVAQFEDGLAKAGIELDRTFLADLSHFIDDPNIMRDIIDEARHYKKGLTGGVGSEPGDYERMIALLAYKALFPRDFDLLQRGQGYVNALLESRAGIIEALQERNLQAASELAAEQKAAREAGDAHGAEEAQAEIDSIRRADLELKRMPLSALIGTMDDAEAFYADPPRREGLEDAQLHSVLRSPYFPFIRFAVGQGWIGETYERFLANYYTESLTDDDQGLIAAIAQGAPADENRIVRNPYAVVSRLDAGTFSLDSARVFALLAHLLANGPADKLKALFAGIGHDGDLGFLRRYVDSAHFDAAVFEVAEEQLDHPLVHIVEDAEADVDARRRFCHRLLADGQGVLADEQLSRAVHAFAQEDARFLSVEQIEPLSIADGLAGIGYKATALDARNCNRELLQFIYDQDLYEPSATVVDELVAALLDAGSALEGGFLVTRIYSLSGTAVRINVEREADLFLRTLLSDTPVKPVDSAEAIAWILGTQGLEPERALAYLYALSDDVVIDRISAIGNPEHQAVLIDRNLVECSAANILDYFAGSGFAIDEHLAALLEANPFPADFTMATAEEHLGEESGFLKAVIACPALSDEKVGEITASYRAQFNRFDVEGISDARAALLIDNGTVRTTADNLRFMRERHPRVAARFAAVEPKAYLRLTMVETEDGQTECGFSKDEALEIFAMNEVDDELKAILLGEFDDPIALSTDYSNDLNTAIAARHFDRTDLLVVDELYSRGNRKLKRALAEAAASYVDELTGKGIVLSPEMTADVAWRLRANRPQMVAFIASQLAGRDEAPSRLEMRDMLERAGLSEYVALIDGPSALVPDTPEDDALLAALAAAGMAGKQVGGADARGLRRVNSKGYSRS